MQFSVKGGALALPLMLSAAPALADDLAATIPVTRPDDHAPAGVMADHVHTSGGVMIGFSWMHERASGQNRQGSGRVSDAAIAAAGFTARTADMAMDMAMLHVMWAPSDRVTLIAMPSWQRMEMTMLGIAPAHGTGHHVLAVDERARHRVSGVGDTQVGALVSLARAARFSAHAGLALSAPTGSVSRRDENGNFVHYGMQPGSGTWDIVPSLTVRGQSDAFGWGAQASHVERAEQRNASGYRLGNRTSLAAWVAKPVGQRVSLSARLVWSREGAIKGHYNSGHNHAAPPDRQANYGGKRLDAGLGANMRLGGHLRFGVEATVPLHQSANGFQAPRRMGLGVNLSQAL